MHQRLRPSHPLSLPTRPSTPTHTGHQNSIRPSVPCTFQPCLNRSSLPLTVVSTPGCIYQAQTKASLQDPAWSDSGASAAATQTTLVLTLPAPSIETGASPTPPEQFYRVVRRP